MKQAIVAGALGFAVAVAGLLLVVNVSADETVAIEDLPDAVRETVEQHLVAGEPVEIEREKENGKIVYSVEQEIEGKEVEFEVSESGEYLGEEAEDDDGDAEDDAEEGEHAVAWEDVPEAAKAGLTSALAGATPTEIVRETEDGATVYEAEYEAGGAEHSVTMSEDGTLLESEHEISTEELPEAVAAHLDSLGAGSIEEAELVTVTFYEIEYKDADGKAHEVKLYANGQELEDD